MVNRTDLRVHLKPPIGNLLDPEKCNSPVCLWRWEHHSSINYSLLKKYLLVKVDHLQTNCESDSTYCYAKLTIRETIRRGGGFVGSIVSLLWKVILVQTLPPPHIFANDIPSGPPCIQWASGITCECITWVTEHQSPTENIVYLKSFHFGLQVSMYEIKCMSGETTSVVQNNVLKRAECSEKN